MSFKSYFAMSTGIKRALFAPAGTIQRIQDRIESTGRQLGFDAWADYFEVKEFWENTTLQNKVLCETADEHNDFVRWLWDYGIPGWTAKKTKTNTERISRQFAAEVWPKMQTLNVPLNRWTEYYFFDRMEALYESMRGRPSEGMIFDSKPLTPQQCGGVLNLISTWLDTTDARVDVPNGHDCIKMSYDGGYDWCEGCGAIHEDDYRFQIKNCRKRFGPGKGCPLRAEAKANGEYDG